MRMFKVRAVCISILCAIVQPTVVMAQQPSATDDGSNLDFVVVRYFPTFRPVASEAYIHVPTAVVKAAATRATQEITKPERAMIAPQVLAYSSMDTTAPPKDLREPERWTVERLPKVTNKTNMTNKPAESSQFVKGTDFIEVIRVNQVADGFNLFMDPHQLRNHLDDLREGNEEAVAFDIGPSTQTDRTHKLTSTTKMKVGQTTVNFFKQFTFKLTPSQASNEALIGGGTADTYHFQTNFDGSDLLRNNNNNLTINFDNLLSLKHNDKAALLDFKLAYKSTPQNDYSNDPTKSDLDDTSFSLNFETNANQELSEGQITVGASYNNPLGKKWLRFSSDLISASSSPLMSFSLNYANRYLQDARISPMNTNPSQLEVEGQFTWDSITLFNTGKDPKNASQYPAIKITANGWWMPSETSMAGFNPRRVAGLFQVELDIPFGALKLTTAKNGGVAPYFRLLYSTGANPANGFVNSSEVTFGIVAQN